MKHGSEHVVTAAQDGMRLDKFLVAALGQEQGVSREALIRLIQEGAVAVHGVAAGKVKPSLRLGVGQVVVLSYEGQAVAPTELVSNPGIDFELLYEDSALAVIGKPAGLATHPQRLDDDSSLASGLIARFGRDLPLAGDSPLKPGIVHRLDAETSGTMVIAKTAEAMASLKKQFREHTVEKRYMAIVTGAPEWDTIACGQPIARDPSRPHGVRIQADGHPARTDFEVAERFRGYARVTARPHTGRTHQIRVHLAHLGFPVVCDKLYRGKSGGAAELRLSELMPEGTTPFRGDRVLLDRHGLHALRLGFTHPQNGERMTVEAPVPEDLDGTQMALRIHRLIGS